MTDADALPCPHCAAGAEHSVQLDPDTISPRPGDLRLCMMCGQLAIWTDKLDLRTPSPSEVRALRSTPSVRTWMRAWKAVYGNTAGPAEG